MTERINSVESSSDAPSKGEDRSKCGNVYETPPPSPRPRGDGGNGGSGSGDTNKNVSPLPVEAAVVEVNAGDGGAQTSLLDLLRAQLEYYFSARNLVGDAFLQSVMNQYQGYVPVSVVANFGNVKKILKKVKQRDGNDVADAANDAQQWVTEAASSSQVLEVVLLQPKSRGGADARRGGFADGLLGIGPRDGKVEGMAVGTVPSSPVPHYYSPAPRHEDRILGGADDCGNLGSPTSVDGSLAGSSLSPVAAKDALVELLQIPPETTPPHSPSPTRLQHQGQPQQERNVVILRDVPSSATEQDVRDMFSSCLANEEEGAECQIRVKSIHADVANCWFVQLDVADHTTDGNSAAIADCILQLRQNTIMGEPVKARLKKERISLGGETREGPSSPGNKTSNRCKEELAAKDCSVPNSSHSAAEDEPNVNSAPSGTQKASNKSPCSGRKWTSTVSTANDGTPPQSSPKNRRNHRHRQYQYNNRQGGGRPSPGRGKKNDLPRSGDRANVGFPPLPPPPPLVDSSHFPTLGMAGENSAEDLCDLINAPEPDYPPQFDSGASKDGDSANQAGANLGGNTNIKAETTQDGKGEEQEPSPSPSCLPLSRIQSVDEVGRLFTKEASVNCQGGYAAALLRKVIPPSPTEVAAMKQASTKKTATKEKRSAMPDGTNHIQDNQDVASCSNRSSSSSSKCSSTSSAVSNPNAAPNKGSGSKPRVLSTSAWKPISTVRKRPGSLPQDDCSTGDANSTVSASSSCSIENCKSTELTESSTLSVSSTCSISSSLAAARPAPAWGTTKKSFADILKTTQAPSMNEAS